MRSRALASAVLAATLMLGAMPARAVLPDEIMADPAKEARARELSKELRCMVCQNQSQPRSARTPTRAPPPRCSASLALL